MKNIIHAQPFKNIAVYILFRHKHCIREPIVWSAAMNSSFCSISCQVYNDVLRCYTYAVPVVIQKYSLEATPNRTYYMATWQQCVAVNIYTHDHISERLNKSAPRYVTEPYVLNGNCVSLLLFILTTEHMVE